MDVDVDEDDVGIEGDGVAGIDDPFVGASSFMIADKNDEDESARADRTVDFPAPCVPSTPTTVK